MPFSWVRGRRVSAAVTGVALGIAGLAVGTASPASAKVSSGTLRNAAPASTVIGRDSIPSSGRYAFLLRLSTDSTASVYTATKKSASAAVARVAARRQLSDVQDAQARVVARLGDIAGTHVLYETHAAMAAVAVTTDVKHVDELAEIPDVANVYPIATKERDLTYAVPLQGAPAAWDGDGSGQNLGEGVTVADIDTGLDYTHADFGGPGTKAAWKRARKHQTAKPAAGTYDPAKFDAADSYDLVGNAYNGGDPDSARPDDTPMPDPNPLDCGLGANGDGHGTHTAGIAAGYGVNADGTTFTGPWNSTTVSTDTASSFEVGPGMAPRATLISYRVFGCEGGTDVISAAVDRALDPNGDGDTSDHVDVINLSLGGDFGSPTDGDSIEADLASKLGVTLAIAMGNAGDQYDVGSSPGVSQRAIAVAATNDAQSVTEGAKISIDGAAPTTYAASRAADYDWSGGDLKGTVVISPSDNPTGCRRYSAADAATIAGKIVMVDWIEEQVATQTDPDQCGSIARGKILRQAGAAGFVFADNHDAMSQTISGDKVIPGVLLAKSGADAIRDAIAAGQTVTVKGTVTSFVQIVPSSNDTLASYSSRGIRATDDAKPDVAAVGDTVFSALVGGGGKGQTMSGTSMATPMVAGEAALIAGKHPDWTPAQIKADIMNTADHDVHMTDSDTRYGPMRVGAGRIDADAALSNSVLAAVDGAPGAVGVSFGAVDVTAATTLTKTVSVANTGDVDRTYAASFDEITSVPGVSVSVSPSTVTVPAGSSATVTVTLSLPDPDTLAATRSWDPTRGQAVDGMSIDTGSGYPQVTLAEESGNLKLTPAQDADVPSLRVPVYANPRPVAQMTQTPTTLPLDQADVPVTLSGTSFAGSATGTTPVVEGFDLQASSPKLPDCDAPGDQLCLSSTADLAGDVSTVGVTSDYPFYAAAGDESPADSALLQFAIGTYGTQGSPAGSIEYDVYIDVDGDGQPDVGVYNTRIGASDVLVAETVDLTKDPTDPSAILDDQPLADYVGADADGLTYDLDLDPMDSDVIVLPVSLSALEHAGLSKQHPVLHYGVITTNLQSGAELDAVGADPLFGDLTGGFAIDPTKPGIWVSGDTVVDGAPSLLADQPGKTVTVHRDADGFAIENGLGAMLVHFHDATGQRVQTLGLPITLTESQTSVEWGRQVGLTVTVPGATSGTVDVSDASSGQVVASGPVRDGTATLGYTPRIDPGAVQLQASYDGPDGTLTSLPVTLTVTKASPMVLVQPRPASVGRGERTTVTVSVLGQPGADVATGTVTVTSQGKRIAAGKLGGDGTFAFPYRSSKPGTVHLVARYSGDVHYASSRSYPTRLTVAKALSRLTVRAPKKARSGAEVTMKVVVPHAAHVAAPTGLVVLRWGLRQLASGQLHASHGNGVVTFHFHIAKRGQAHLKLLYSGDQHYRRATTTKLITITP